MPMCFTRSLATPARVVPLGKLGARLSAQEQELFRVLKMAKNHSRLNTTLRVAGGWVRDKLWKGQDLLIHHHHVGGDDDGSGGWMPDIDIAVDDMSGEAFTEHLCHYLEQSPPQDRTRVGVIRANPEKSKHLETATMNVCGLSVDFVNLRSEEYNQSSRIPSKVNIGSPLDDVLRRDVTINALFYNIDTEQVEDWTGLGLMDLENGILRAAHPSPAISIRDDPLRAMRVLRFRARFGMKVEESLMRHISSQATQTALLSKVSVERVNKELFSMLKCVEMAPILSALHDMLQWGWGPILYRAGCWDKEDSQRAWKRLSAFAACYTHISKGEFDTRAHHHTKIHHRHHHHHHHLMSDPHHYMRNIGLLGALYSAIALPKMPDTGESLPHRRVVQRGERNLCSSIIRHQKLSKVQASAICGALYSCAELHLLLNRNAHENFIDGDVGEWLEGCCSPSEWPIPMMLAVALRNDSFTTWVPQWIQRVMVVKHRVEQPPILSGEDVLQLGFKGRAIGEALAMVRWMQLNHGESWTREDAIHHLVHHDKQRWREERPC